MAEENPAVDGSDTRHSSFGNFVKIRRSKKADIVTGCSSAHNTREQVVMIRPPGERKAMGTLSRRRLESHDGRWVTRPCWAACDRCADCWVGVGREDADHRMGMAALEEGEDKEADDGKVQYTLESSRRGATKSILPCLALRQNFCYCCSRTTMSDDYVDESERNVLFINVNDLLADFLSWAFCTSYFKLLVMFSIFYFLYIVVFAAIYYGISKQWPMCINSNGQEIGQVVNIFGDCFQLSWTTFSTVGYGLIYPATGASDFYVPTGCTGVGVIGSFEAFLGVLFAGFITSVLFGKVMRSQNNAQVFFSDPIVIRYGNAELSSERASKKHAAAKNKEEGTSDDKNIPCPLLEFRLMNRLHDSSSGEIVEAKLTCVAILDPKISKLRNDAMKVATSVESPDGASTNKDVISSKTTVDELTQRLVRDSNARPSGRGLEFHSSDSKQPHNFVKVPLESDEHPFFRRVWFGKHRLDEHSPLLAPSVRRRIKSAGGHWPADLNNYRSIKDCVHFRHLLVNISGMANANATSVYAQKVYDLVDVNVGYRFVTMNYKDQGTLKTDPYLLSAVYQQKGGGGEPMHGH